MTLRLVSDQTSAGSIPLDFPLPPSPVVRLAPHHARLLPAALFHDLELVPRGRADATLAPGGAARSERGLVLHAEHAWLRAPPVPGRNPRYAVTLSSVTGGRNSAWSGRLLDRDDWFTPAVRERGAEMARRVTEARVGGTWWGAHARAARVVVFATRCPDLSLRLLGSALGTTEAAAITLVAPQPGPAARAARRFGVNVLRGVHDPWPLIEDAEQVFAAPGSAEALVAAFVRPGPEVARLAAATLLLGARYVEPFHLTAVPGEDFLGLAAEWRRLRDRNGAIGCCVGISFWKRPRVAAMLAADRPPAFRTGAHRAIAAAKRRGGGIAVWPSRAPPGLDALAAQTGVAVFRLEDGFVRSVGLGADFRPPLSLVLDPIGIYYDATAPSELEDLLSATVFDPALLRRAAALRARVVQERVTKYNLAGAPGLRLPRRGRVVLVPGQVSDDRSVLLGGGGMRPGLHLLRRVRMQAPDAHIVYKPHPDVDAGHRAGAVPDRQVMLWADDIVRGGSMADLLSQVDEVHTLTSSTGFEAMLREIQVTTYGQPFYAGWGLTTDLNPPLRRTRRLSLDELIAGTLIIYPRYFDPVTQLGCGPEIVLDRLRDPALHRAGPLVMARRLLGQVKRFHRGPPMTSSPRMFLFLQGLASGFFDRLGAALAARGHGVMRVNLNGGDLAMWRQGNAVNYRGRLCDWPGFVADLLVRRGVTDIVLFGDCRPMHRSAIEVAQRLRVAIHVVEEGYLRPDWVTLELGGVNGHSTLPRDPGWYHEAAAKLAPVAVAAPLASSFRRRSIEDLVYNISTMVLWPLFPHYRTHRPWHALVEYAGWAKRLLLLPRARRRSGRALRALEGGAPFFLFPLQLDCDSQVRLHSSFSGMRQAIDTVLRSYAAAGVDALIVVKEHPLDNGLVNWRRFVTRLAQELGISSRLVFVEQGDIVPLVERARGVVTVNSTTGTLALASGTPVITLGTAIYDLASLTFQGSLDAFWTDGTPPDAALFEAFRRVLVHRCLIGGGFFSERGLAMLVEGAVPRLEAVAPGRALQDTAAQPSRYQHDSAASPALGG